MLDCGAVLGKRGSGKSVTARMLFEHEVDVGHRCGIIDPMGDAAGIRLKPDMTPSRFKDVIIFGGPRAYIPISDEDGGKVARILATHPISFIVDLSDMIQAEQLRFMTSFADVLFEAIKIPLTLFVDEAHVFAPQQRGDATAMLLNRMVRLNSQGRKRGIFLWLMTQRPARINKNILGGTETLIAMKVTMPQDIDPIGTWLDGHDPEKAKVIKGQLPKLKVGEAYVWFSGKDWLGRVQMPMHTTLDTGKTPLHGETVGDYVIPKADIGDLAKLFGDMATGDPRDDEIKRLESIARDLREDLRSLRATYSDECADHVKTRAREDALLDILTDMQNRIGFIVGSPLITPRGAGGRYEDFLPVMVPGGNELRFHRRTGRAVDQVGAAVTRMRTAQNKEKKS